MSKPIKAVRIYISESDKADNHNLMNEIFARLHDQHKVHGMTVFRGIAGFGVHGQVHSADLLRLHADLPLVIEFFDDPKIIEETLEWITGLVRPGHVIVWDAEVE